MRLKDLLGLSLEELRTVMHGEDQRAVRRREWHESPDPAERRRILTEGMAHTDALLGLVCRRREALAEFEADLDERRRLLAHHLAELDERT